MLSEKKKIFLVSFIVIAFIGYAFVEEGTAVPAAPFVHTINQPDGATFQARQWGDESLHGWETEDGYSIIFDENLNSWTYAASIINGRLLSSSRIVGRDAPPVDVPKRLRQKDTSIPSKMLSREMMADILLRYSPFSTAGYQEIVPPTGTGNIPVILINFKDRTTTYASSNFNTLLFSTGTKSLKDYYNEVSYSAFTVSAGPGGIKGWYKAANNHAYYGSNDSWGYDMWPGTLVREAVIAADSTIDFAPYDQDGDCYVDVVAIVHQGNGEHASGVEADIWAHRWSLNSAYSWGYSNAGAYTTNDPCPAGGFIKVNDYIIQPEILYGQIQTIGVFAHEYAHALGLPDLYDTDYSSNGIGDWSLMASGTWNYTTMHGDSPAHLDAWSKYKLGWVTPAQVTTTLTNETITQAATTADVYQLLSGTPTSGEYFLVENRQKKGFDAGLPGSGLLIWHIDGNTISSKMFSNTVNNYECYPGGPSCATGHYGVRLVQSDNLWDLEKYTNYGNAGDPYPGSFNKTAFTSASSPNSKFYNGTSSGVSITDISASGPNMTATLSVGTGVTINAPSNLTARAISTSRIVIGWKDNSTNETSFKIYRRVGSGSWSLLFTTAADVISYTDTTAAGNTTTNTYSYKIQACNTAVCSPETSVLVVPYKPTNFTATKVSSTQINLKWSDMSANERGFQIHRKAGTCSSTNSWSLLATKVANSTTHSDTGLASGTFSYRTRSFTRSAATPYAFGYSLWSECKSAIISH